jgi:hypothetical protein
MLCLLGALIAGALGVESDAEDGEVAAQNRTVAEGPTPLGRQVVARRVAVGEARTEIRSERNALELPGPPFAP